MAAHRDNVRVKLDFSKLPPSAAHRPLKCWFLVDFSSIDTVLVLIKRIIAEFCLNIEYKTVYLALDGYMLPNWEDTRILRDNDSLCFICDHDGSDLSCYISDENSAANQGTHCTGCETETIQQNMGKMKNKQSKNSHVESAGTIQTTEVGLMNGQYHSKKTLQNSRKRKLEQSSSAKEGETVLLDDEFCSSGKYKFPSDGHTSHLVSQRKVHAAVESSCAHDTVANPFEDYSQHDCKKKKHKKKRLEKADTETEKQKDVTSTNMNRIEILSESSEKRDDVSPSCTYTSPQNTCRPLPSSYETVSGKLVTVDECFNSKQAKKKAKFGRSQSEAASITNSMVLTFPEESRASHGASGLATYCGQPSRLDVVDALPVENEFPVDDIQLTSTVSIDVCPASQIRLAESETNSRFSKVSASAATSKLCTNVLIDESMIQISAVPEADRSKASFNSETKSSSRKRHRKRKRKQKHVNLMAVGSFLQGADMSTPVSYVAPKTLHRHRDSPWPDNGHHAHVYFQDDDEENNSETAAKGDESTVDLSQKEFGQILSDSNVSPTSRVSDSSNYKTARSSILSAVVDTCEERTSSQSPNIDGSFNSSSSEIFTAPPSRVNDTSAVKETVAQIDSKKKNSPFASAPVFRRQHFKKMPTVGMNFMAGFSSTNGSRPPLNSTSLSSPVQVTRDFSVYKLFHGPPKAGDTIAYKILQLGEDYTPRLSDYLEAVVVAYDENKKMVQLHLKSNAPVKKNPGRFDLTVEYEDEILTNTESSDNSQVTAAWADLSDVRLIET